VNFRESEAYLLSLGNEVSAMKLGLENISTLLEALGSPQDKYLKVQVAGTNGKGSVCAFLNSICLSAGIKTGMFTSPHLTSITERIQIGGADIREEDFARHSTDVRDTAEKLLAAGKLRYRPTFFEQITAIALTAFAEARVELAILETGLGGRLDATSAAHAEIAAITRIDLDHQEYLGETIEEIAAEKAAIITAKTQAVVLGAQSPSVMRLLQKHCSEVGIIPINERPEPWHILKAENGLVRVVMPPVTSPPFSLGLRGDHQIENAETAIRIAKALRDQEKFANGEPSDGSVIEGLQRANHPGRLETVGKYLLDGAHNSGGAYALAEYIRDKKTRPITLIFGAMSDKNVSEMLKTLAPLAARIVVTEPLNPRSVSYNELLETLPADVSKERTFATNNVASAIAIANAVTPDDGIILVTGSLYLVGEAKKLLQNGPET
jgi:dihydrofolate synthase/folylpolyglutamate synthase